MPSNPTHLRQSPMSVAIDHHHFKPWKRRCRLRSFPHPDPNLLDLANLPPSPFSSRRRKFNRSLSTPCFSTSVDGQQHPDHIPAVEIIGSRRSCGIHSLVIEAAIAIACGAVPIPASSGLGGAFFLRCHRTGECFAVVKPIEQEPLSTLSTVISRPGSRLSVRPGETGLREVAAYLLDHGGFSGVPPTALIKISHPALHTAATASSDSTCLPQRTIASIQRFVPHDFDAGDLGPSRFSVASVHRIGILDLRLFNIDRHAGNLLVRKHIPNSNIEESMVAELVPIDHGLCLPELLDDPYFEWLHWPQAAVPFSDVEAEYVAALDPLKDAQLLGNEIPSLREPAIRILILCTTFLKRAVASGLCLGDIGGMMTRDFCGVEEGPSVLESLCKRAEDSIKLSEDSSNDDETDSSGDDDDEHKGFQFEMDRDDDDGGGFSEKCMQVEDIPILLRSRELKKVLGAVSEEVEELECEDVEGRESPMKLGSITKSVSFSAADLSSVYDCGGGGSGSNKCISFKGMDDEEWGLFLERFEQLLPEEFEARKMSMGLKQRLGTSCKF